MLIISNWLPEPWPNITMDFDSITNTFQDVRHVGELRQRWKEIKKLLKGGLQNNAATVAVGINH